MEEWKKVKLGDCIKEIVEKTTINNQYKVLSVTKDGIYSQEEFFKKQIASENNVGYKVIRKNNLVFSTMNLWMGSLDVLTNYDIGIVSPAYKIFEFNEELMLPEYGNYYMKSHYMLEKYKDCSEQGASVVRRNLNLKDLLDVEVKVPSIVEQKKIVDILKNVDLIIEKIEKEIQIIESQKDRYLNLLLNKDNLKNAEWVELKDICKIITKGTTAKKFTNQGIKFVKIEALERGIIFNDKCSYIGEDEHNGFLKRSILKENDILFAIAGSIGKCAVVRKENLPANTNQALAIIRLKDTNNTEYVLKILESVLMKKYIRMNLTVGAQPNLNLDQIGKFKIPIVESKVKTNILNVVNIYETKIMLSKDRKNEYQLLRKGLIQRLLNGKIRVKV